MKSERMHVCRVRLRIWGSACVLVHAFISTDEWGQADGMLTLSLHVLYPMHASQRPFTSIWLPFFGFHTLLREVWDNCKGRNRVAFVGKIDILPQIILSPNIRVPLSCGVLKQCLPLTWLCCRKVSHICLKEEKLHDVRFIFPKTFWTLETEVL